MLIWVLRTVTITYAEYLSKIYIYEQLCCESSCLKDLVFSENLYKIKPYFISSWARSLVWIRRHKNSRSILALEPSKLRSLSFRFASLIRSRVRIPAGPYFS